MQTNGVDSSYETEEELPDAIADSGGQKTVLLIANPRQERQKTQEKIAMAMLKTQEKIWGLPLKKKQARERKPKPKRLTILMQNPMETI